METNINLEEQNPEGINRLKLEAAVNELSDFNTQIYSINNILHLLYDFLENETPDIAEPASAMVICMYQLEYIYKRLDELLDTVLDCSSAR